MHRIYSFLGITLILSSCTLATTNSIDPETIKQFLLSAAQEQSAYALESAYEYANTLPNSYRSGYSANISNAIFSKIQTALKASFADKTLSSFVINEQEVEAFDEALDLVVTLLARYSAGRAAQTTPDTNDISGVQNLLRDLESGAHPASSDFESKMQQAITSVTAHRQPRNFGQGSYLE